MADELDPVEQKFIADMDQYLADLEAGATEAKAFADASKEASDAVDGMRDHATETGAALDDLAAQADAAKNADNNLRDSATETAAALDAERDKAIEAATAAGVYADATGRLHQSNGQFLSDAAAAELGISNFKDELIRAAEGTVDLGTGADQASEKADKFREEMDRTRESITHAEERVTSLKEKLTGLFESVKGAVDGGVTKALSLLFGGGGEGGEGGGLAGKLPEGLPDGIPLLGGVSPAALIAIVPAIEAASVEVTGLVSGFAAAGAGAGAFALLAKPAFDQVKTAYTSIQTDQKAYDNALTATAKNTALKKLQQDYKDLDPAELGAVKGIQQLMDTYHAMAKAFEPDAFKVFNDGLKLANELLPDVKPFADTFATSLDGLLQQAGKFAGSTGFKDWLAQFQKLEGPSVTAIGDGIGKVAVAIGKLLTTMSAKDVVHAINIAFDILAGTISAVTYMVHTLMTNWDQMSNATDAVRESIITAGHAIEDAVDAVRETFITAGHGIEDATDAVRESVVRAGHDIESAWDTTRHAVATAGHDIANGFDEARHAAATAGHDIVAGLEAAANWIQSRWREIVAWLVDPVGMAVYEIRTHTHDIAEAFDTARHDAAAAVTGMGHDISSDFDSMRHDIASFGDWVPNEIKNAFGNAQKSGNAAASGLQHDLASDWDSMRHDLASFADWVPQEIAQGFDNARHDAAAAIDGARHDLASDYASMRSDVSSFASSVVSFFKSLPGEIVSALSALPGELEAAGRNAIEGLINGIKDAAAAIPGIMKGLASDVESYFTDPLKIFSPSRVFYEHGVNTVQGYINGIKAATPAVRSAMASLGGSIAAGGITGTGSAVASASSVHVNVPITLGAGTQGYNNPAFLQYIQQTVQEATLRYTQVNPSNGLNLAGKLA